MRVQNDLRGTQWTSTQYKDHIESLAGNPQNMFKFVVCFNKERQRTAPPRDNSRNPNKSRRGPVYDADDEEAKETKRKMAARFREAFFHATADPTDLEYCKPVTDTESESDLREKAPGKPAPKSQLKPKAKAGQDKTPEEFMWQKGVAAKKAPASIWKKKESGQSRRVYAGT